MGSSSGLLPKVIYYAERSHPRGKPGFSTYESDLGRETDSPLEQTGFEPPVRLLRVSLDSRGREGGRRSIGVISKTPSRTRRGRETRVFDRVCGLGFVRLSIPGVFSKALARSRSM